MRLDWQVNKAMLLEMDGCREVIISFDHE